MRYLEIRKDFKIKKSGDLHGIYLFETKEKFQEFSNMIINEIFLVENNDEAILVNIPKEDPNIAKALSIGFKEIANKE